MSTLVEVVKLHNLHRPFDTVRDEWSNRNPELGPFFQQVDSLDTRLQNRIASRLSLMGILEDNLSTETLPHTLRENLPSLTHNHTTKILLNKKTTPEENTREAIRFFCALRQFGMSFTRLSQLAQGDAELSRFGDYQLEVNMLDRARSIIVPSFANNYSEKLNIDREVETPLSRLFNKLADQAIPVVENAYNGDEVDGDLLQSVGDVLHHAALLNEKRVDDYSLTPDERAQAKTAAIKQHLALIKNDLLGYHGDTPLQTAQDTMWHARRIEKIFPRHHETKDIIVPYLEDLAEKLAAKLQAVLPESHDDLAPSQLPALISLIETDELLLENLSPRNDEDRFVGIADRLISSYELLAQFHSRTESHKDAISAYNNILEISKDLGRVPSEKSLMGYVTMLKERAEALPDGERGVVWNFHISNLLIPYTSFGFEDQDSLNLAAEIALLENKLIEGKLKGNSSLRKLAASIILMVEDPSNIGLEALKTTLQAVEKEQRKEYSGSNRDRLIQIANFFVRGWEDRGKSYSADPLREYHHAVIEESLQALGGVTGILRREGILAEKNAAQTDQAGIRVMIRQPSGSGKDNLEVFRTFGLPRLTDLGGRAAPMIVKKEKATTAQQARIILNEKEAKRRGFEDNEIPLSQLVLGSESLHIPQDTSVKVSDAVALVPAIDSPWATQPDFYLQLTTNGAAVSIVVREGRIMGSFITTNSQPTLPISELTGQHDSRLWHPNLLSSMSLEDKLERGDLVGTIQLISFPIVIDDRRFGKEDDNLLPIPSGGLSIPDVRTDYPVQDDSTMLDLRNAFVAILLAAIARKRQKTDLTFKSNSLEDLNVRGYTLDLLFRGGGTKSYGPQVRSASILASPSLHNLTSRQTRAQRALIQATGIGTSTTPGSNYGTFTGDYRVNTAIPPSLFRLSIAAVTRDNADRVIENVSRVRELLKTPL